MSCLIQQSYIFDKFRSAEQNCDVWSTNICPMASEMASKSLKPAPGLASRRRSSKVNFSRLSAKSLCIWARSSYTRAETNSATTVSHKMTSAVDWHVLTDLVRLTQETESRVWDFAYQRPGPSGYSTALHNPNQHNFNFE